jgi:hypothetical protein
LPIVKFGTMIGKDRIERFSTINLPFRSKAIDFEISRIVGPQPVLARYRKRAWKSPADPFRQGIRRGRPVVEPAEGGLP